MLLEQLLAEYRTIADPDRAFIVARWLEQVKSDKIATLGEEMTHSGNLITRQAGLDILGGQQPHNNRARDIISAVLEQENDPAIKVAALNALATPTNVPDKKRQHLIQQFKALTTHLDPVVRRHSLSMLSRWARKQNLNDYYLNGLSDPDSQVREFSLLSLVDTEHPETDVYFALVRIIENSSEKPLARRNALSGLRQYDITGEELDRYRQMISESGR